MRPDLRTRLLGAVLDGAIGPATSHSPELRQRLRSRRGPQALGRLLQGRPAEGVTTRDLVAAGHDRDVAVRLYRRRRTPCTGLVVVLPGGGWVYGGLGATEWLSSHLAARTGALVAEVGYRLAPEHPAPAAHQDAYAATAWLAEHAESLGALGGRTALVGESAGGALAASTALDARDRGRPPITLQALLYPATDLTLASPSVVERGGSPVLNEEALRAYVSLYLGDLADPHDPLVSPLLAADHRDLPPAVVITAEHDPLRDDGLRYAAALRACGVPVRHHETAGSAHGFVSFAGVCRRPAEAALEVLTNALQDALRPGCPNDRGSGGEGRSPALPSTR